MIITHKVVLNPTLYYASMHDEAQSSDFLLCQEKYRLSASHSVLHVSSAQARVLDIP